MTAPDFAGDSAPRFAAVGAGRIGRGIAIAFAYAGHRISLVDLRVRSDEAWCKLRDEARVEIESSLLVLAQFGVLTREQVPEIAARVEHVNAAGAPRALAAAELVFEGVPETLEAKREAFAEINAHCRAAMRAPPPSCSCTRSLAGRRNRHRSGHAALTDEHGKKLRAALAQHMLV